MAYVAPTIRSVGDAVTAADYNIIANDVLQFAPMVQGVFTNEAARDAAITSPTEGMHAYLTAPTVPAATGAYTVLPSGIQTIYNGSVWVCTTPVGASQSANGTTTSNSYTATLSSGGTNPSVTLVTGTSVLLSVGASMANSIASNQSLTAIAVSGATTIAAGTAGSTEFSNIGVTITTYLDLNQTFLMGGLTAGTNTFTLNYVVSTGTTGNFRRRTLFAQGIA